MPSLAKILVPVDFSGRCRGGARYVEALATRFHSAVVLLHVLPPPHYEFGAMEPGGTALSELHAARAAQVKCDLESHLAGEFAGLSVKRVLLEGDPARKIVEHAAAEGADLILMPTHGYGPFRRFILGSVTAKVLHDADCPVMTGVHLEQAPPIESISFRRVLVAVDLGPQSSRALGWASWLASVTGAALSLLHVTPSLEGPEGEYYDRDWREKQAGEARGQVDALIGEAGCEPEILIQNGDPPGVICDAARRLAADLLVIGRGSAAGMFGRLRTNAYAIIRQSPCPVVSV
ncbi:MAG TPA: universal stress protein [Bryobacteraceae bacterium]|nr:universal stress protein [Bryobacteraceae bacterium]